jgi:hypothetical protein
MSTAAVTYERTDWPYVTVVSAAGHVHRATVDGWATRNPIRSGTIFRWYNGAVYSETVLVDDEGITWTRGWHDDASEAVQALLVARALVTR